MKKIGEYFTKHIGALIALIVVIAALTTFVGFKIGSNDATVESSTTKLSFENIGELATQSAYCTQVTVEDKDQKFFNISVPFTQTKYIYSYNVVVKAGYDFEEITYNVDDTAKTIKVQLPEVKILSTEVDTDSFQVYHEQTSAFTHVSLEESNKALDTMQKEAEENAIANGLYENARTNAEALLKGYFSAAYDLEEYTITFE